VCKVWPVLNNSDYVNKFDQTFKTRNLVKIRPFCFQLLDADRPLERTGRIWRG